MLRSTRAAGEEYGITFAPCTGVASPLLAALSSLFPKSQEQIGNTIVGQDRSDFSRGPTRSLIHPHRFPVSRCAIPCSIDLNSLFRAQGIRLRKWRNSAVLGGIQTPQPPPKNGKFPVNQPITGNNRQERGSLRTASRTKQSFAVLISRLRAPAAPGMAQFSGVCGTRCGQPGRESKERGGFRRPDPPQFTVWKKAASPRWAGDETVRDHRASPSKVACTSQSPGKSAPSSIWRISDAGC